MQDRYAFDLGDFSKLGLIRLLQSADPTHRIGLLWYANTPGRREELNKDGKHIGYLCPNDETPNARAERRFRVCDQELYDAMRAAMRAERPRSIAELERLHVWPTGTRWFGKAVPAGGGDERKEWFRSALSAVAGCSLVVCDPDNGIAWDGISTSAKHIFAEEIAGIVATGASAVIYHHCDRSASHDEQGRRHAEEIVKRHGGLAQVIPLRFRRGTSRLYMVLAQPAHRAWIERTIAAMQKTPWCTLEHFSIIGRT